MFIESMLSAARERLVTVKDDALVIEMAKLLLDRNIDLLVVCSSDGLICGVVTKTDVVRQMSICRGSGCTMAASSVMTRAVIQCQPADMLKNVWLVMKDHGLKNIPIVGADSQPIGVLNARDALQALREEVECEENLLRDYVMCVGWH